MVCIILTSRGVATANGTQQQPRLKESVMAYLAYPVSGWSDEEMKVDGEQRSEKLEELAKGMKARFDVDGAGRWRFWRN